MEIGPEKIIDEFLLLSLVIGPASLVLEDHIVIPSTVPLASEP